MFSLSPFLNFLRIRSGVVLTAPASVGYKVDVEKKLGLPRKPKRPNSSYCLFIRKIMPEVRARYPKWTASEHFKEACAQWKTVDPKVMKELEELADKERLKYFQAMEKYNASISVEEKAALREAYATEKLLKERRESKKKLASLGMPKKPMNSYLLFVNEWLRKNPNVSQKEANQQCAALWKALPESEKEKYQASHKKLDEEYQKKLKAWEADMIKQGKLEILYDSPVKTMGLNNEN